ncbi:spindle assembly checkpoint component Mad1 [Chytriomyces sp. MP71]|nr:spindle assembly checkpoint component Mad1 [Chytriomyces sp. MP71]
MRDDPTTTNQTGTDRSKPLFRPASAPASVLRRSTASAVSSRNPNSTPLTATASTYTATIAAPHSHHSLKRRRMPVVVSASVSAVASSSSAFSRLQPASIDDVLNTFKDAADQSQSSSQVISSFRSSARVSPHRPSASSSSTIRLASTNNSLSMSLASSRSVDDGGRGMDLNSDGGLLGARKQIKSLERDLATAQGDAEKRVIALDCDKKNLELALAESKSVIEKLESQRAFLLERDKKMSEKLKGLEDEMDLDAGQKDTAIAKLRSDKASLVEKCSMLEHKLNDVERKCIFDEDNLKKDLEDAQAQIALLSRQVQEESQQKLAALKSVSAIQASRSEPEQRSMVRRPDDAMTISVLHKQLEEQLEHIRSLESANSALQKELLVSRSSREGILTLQEKNRSLENQLANMVALRERLSAVELEVTTLRGEKESWISMLRESDLREFGLKGASPLDFVRCIASERLERAREKERMVDEISRMKTVEARSSELEREMCELREARIRLEGLCDSQGKQLKRLEKGRELSIKETHFLREQLNIIHFEDDNQSGRNAAERIAGMELVLNDYKSHISHLEAELSFTGPTVTGTSTQSPATQSVNVELIEKVKRLEKELHTLQSEKEGFVKEAETLHRQIHVLETAIGQGAFDRTKLKVLQLAENPETRAFAIRQETLETLQVENKALQARLLGSEFGALVPVEVVKSAELECQRLCKLVEERDKRIMRLREVFTDKSREFKEAVFSLLGSAVLLPITQHRAKLCHRIQSGVSRGSRAVDVNLFQ